ncbi:DMT family transporter [Uliginosibacterium gangwonense]|uniref:DMT family transporter n=1 Tax=Uliginosibacterium gangwonense TaxID=392736 RepID=UPI0012FA4382|nr:DMT family transporter [Uliginosibacterium gangwonense]
MISRQSMPRAGLFLLMIVVLGWGVSWTVIKHAVYEIPPLTIRGVSAVMGGACLMLLTRLQGVSLVVPRKHWLRLSVLALFNILIWNVLSTYGVLYLPSGKAALLAYTMPLWCVPLSIWMLHDMMSVRRAVALLLGCCGVAVLLGREALDLVHAPIGVILMLAAALVWACGVVMMKRWSLPLDAGVMTAWMLLLGGLPLLPAAVIVDGIPSHMPSASALFAVLFSAGVTFMLCNWAWNRLVMLVPVSVSSLSSLLTPLVGVASGAVFLGERPGWSEALAAMLILGAVAVINTAPKPAAAKAVTV